MPPHPTHPAADPGRGASRGTTRRAGRRTARGTERRDIGRISRGPAVRRRHGVADDEDGDAGARRDQGRSQGGTRPGASPRIAVRFAGIHEFAFPSSALLREIPGMPAGHTAELVNRLSIQATHPWL